MGEATLEFMHFFLAYAGMLVHMLLKIQGKSKIKGFTFGGWMKDNLYHSLATVISIPVLLITLTDPFLHELLPINYVTAVLAGYQTQEFFKGLVNMAGKRIKGEENEKTS